ncbi:IS110 family transposase [Laspinema olomoucense]|uniref:IS110 family transposase n=1 Tax=Laspinema olomoucense TaxID=3231600 RepID=UPI0021BAB100|nr:transposase [Laspinema sp. D3a]MCT7988841.1 transposase [Laspinema sp. D3a]
MNEKPLVIGLDVSKDNVVACPLTEAPYNLKLYFKENKESFPRLYSNRDGIRELLAMKPEYVVMEPTGVHYSWIWAHILKSHGIKILWVGHSEVASFRKSKKLPDKNDAADALALAAYALGFWNYPEAFLGYEHECFIIPIRDFCLKLQSLNRIQSPIINRLRQQLAREFPEAALKDSQRASDGQVPLWCFIGGRKRNIKKDRGYYEKLYQVSIAPAYGVEISEYSRNLANQLCQLTDWEIAIEEKLGALLRQPELIPYNRVMDDLGMGLRIKCWVISQIFPIERFLGSGNYRNWRARFKQRLGYGGIEHSSGDKESTQKSGSKISRQMLYLWIVTAIAPARNRPDTPIAKQLAEFYDTRTRQYNDNPEIYHSRLLEKQKQDAIATLKTQLGPLLSPAIVHQVEQNLSLALDFPSMIGPDGKTTEPVKKGEAKKRFGKLIVSQTAAKGVELLFNELMSILHPKA